MKKSFSFTNAPAMPGRIHLGLVFAVALTFLHHDAQAIPATVNLGTDSSFAVMAASEITDAGGASMIECHTLEN